MQKFAAGVASVLLLMLAPDPANAAAPVSAAESGALVGPVYVAAAPSVEREGLPRTPSGSRAASDPQNAPALPEYRPPRRGAPKAKVTGGVRTGIAQPYALTLVPEDGGHTISAAPALFWYIDAVPAENVKVIFSLIDPDQIDPVVEREIARPERSGIHRVELESLGVELQPGIEYEWWVALVIDPSRRSLDVITNGSIERVPDPRPPGDREASVQTYAQLGLWYDALAEVSDAVDQRPADPWPRQARDALLLQGELQVAVEAPARQ